jgi:hypothetical protein
MKAFIARIVPSTAEVKDGDIFAITVTAWAMWPVSRAFLMIENGNAGVKLDPSVSDEGKRWLSPSFDLGLARREIEASISLRRQDSTILTKLVLCIVDGNQSRLSSEASLVVSLR